MNQERLDSYKTSKDCFDLTIDIVYTNSFNEYINDKIIYKNDFYIVIKRNHEYMICYYVDQMIYALFQQTNETKYQLYVLNDIKEKNYFLITLMRLEKLIAFKKCFILHSSCVEINQEAILFSAPSGTGKSTQADLWSKYKNALVINGDKNIVGLKKNRWHVFGIPFSGSSEYCLNKTLPIKAIVLLDQAPTNQLLKINEIGFKRILSQTTINTWDESLSEMIIDLVSQACLEIPIYYYACTKEEDAVHVLYDELYGGNDHGII